VTIEDTSKVEVSANLRMDQLYWVLDQQKLSTDALMNAAQAARYELPRNEVKIRYQLSGRESAIYEWNGVLARYEGAGIDPQSRTVPVRIVVDKPHEYLINGLPAHESNMSGPSSLVRGMFVEAVIQAKPTTPLLLVPKLSVKPATGTNQIWKFVPDDQMALEQTRAKLRAANNLANEAAQTTDDATTSSLIVEDPDQWQAGFLTIISGVTIIGPYRPRLQQNRSTVASESFSVPSKVPTVTNSPVGDNEPIEYWICEVADGNLVAGDKVVVTPLPGIEAEGDEAIRVHKSQL
jgi:multidrug efflux pump subunit AcrA (membrane-fusion protein)